MSEETPEVRGPEPKFFKSTTVWLGDSKLTIASVLSWVEIVVVAFVVTLFYAGFSAKAHTPVKDAVGWGVLKIDGNRAKHAVLFPHEAHKDRIGKNKDACITCHHMSKPMDGPTSCYVCHRDMYLWMPIFNHESHQEALGGNASCIQCHEENKAKENVKRCKECHSEYTEDPDDYVARSYEAAMHSRCVGCHKKEAKKGDRQRLYKCNCCHKDTDT